MAKTFKKQCKITKLYLIFFNFSSAVHVSVARPACSLARKKKGQRSIFDLLDLDVAFLCKESRIFHFHAAASLLVAVQKTRSLSSLASDEPDVESTDDPGCPLSVKILNEQFPLDGRLYFKGILHFLKNSTTFRNRCSNRTLLSWTDLDSGQQIPLCSVDFSKYDDDLLFNGSVLIDWSVQLNSSECNSTALNYLQQTEFQAPLANGSLSTFWKSDHNTTTLTSTSPFSFPVTLFQLNVANTTTKFWNNNCSVYHCGTNGVCLLLPDDGESLFCHCSGGSCGERCTANWTCDGGTDHCGSMKAVCAEASAAAGANVTPCSCATIAGEYSAVVTVELCGDDGRTVCYNGAKCRSGFNNGSSTLQWYCDCADNYANSTCDDMRLFNLSSADDDDDQGVTAGVAWNSTFDNVENNFTTAATVADGTLSTDGQRKKCPWVCLNGGQCVPGIGCRCPKMYLGLNCAFLHTCETYAPCQNGGQCHLTNAMELADEVRPFTANAPYWCNCSDGWRGDHCELSSSSIDEPAASSSCATNQCHNGGVCDEITFRCDCAGTGHRGNFCELPIDHCVEYDGACGAHGVCVNQKTHFQCDCHAGYYALRAPIIVVLPDERSFVAKPSEYYDRCKTVDFVRRVLHHHRVPTCVSVDEAVTLIEGILLKNKAVKESLKSLDWLAIWFRCCLTTAGSLFSLPLNLIFFFILHHVCSESFRMHFEYILRYRFPKLILLARVVKYAALLMCMFYNPIFFILLAFCSLLVAYVMVPVLKRLQDIALPAGNVQYAYHLYMNATIPTNECLAYLYSRLKNLKVTFALADDFLPEQRLGAIASSLCVFYAVSCSTNSIYDLVKETESPLRSYCRAILYLKDMASSRDVSFFENDLNSAVDRILKCLQCCCQCSDIQYDCCNSYTSTKMIA
ncbi:Uncharacterized protein T07_4515 [Trichinella nelsoni]|uniref:EGF-like domain-containing protein n=1 Tax=Trichinella nelsoni TaxID=6336 RepID=A0A0V0RTC0_9BILA|nr:Uncharacterized protein T07_4515 [Trichinella nelsoni]